MKIFGLLEEFSIEFNISLSIGIGSPVDGEFLLLKSCFEVGLRLSLPRLLRMWCVTSTWLQTNCVLILRD